MIQFSLITKDVGILTKKYSLVDGELVKDSKQCYLTHGHVETIEMEFKDLPEFLDNLKHNQAIIHGITPYAPSEVVAKRLLSTNPKAIARVKENFFWPDEGIIMFDYDPPPGEKPLSKRDLILAIRHLHPQLREAAMVWRPSASSNIVGVNGKVYKGLENQRVYVEYRNPENMPEFIENLKRIAWDQGHGWLYITAAGTVLPRQLFDTAVFSPERLDFAAGAVCGEGLKPQIVKSVYEKGKPVDLYEVGDEYSEERYKIQVETKKQESKLDIKEARARYKQIQAERLAGAKGISKAKARRVVSARLKNKILPDDVIYTNDMQTIEVRDIIMNPEKYHEMVVRDPLEPEYGESKAKIFTDDEQITINSFAHGGRVFTVKFDAACYIELLKNITDEEELLESWMDRIGDFIGTEADKEKIVKAVSKRTGVGKTTLMKDLKGREKSIKEENLDTIEDLSHHQIAERVISQLPKYTVATEGKIYTYNGANCWKPMGMQEVQLEVATRFDTLPKCSRRSDYVSIAKQIYILKSEDRFFHSTSPVVATKDGCWLLEKDTGVITKRPHDPRYRVRFLLPFETVKKNTPMPMFSTFLDWCFEGEPEQALLLQEIFGAVMFCTLNRWWHKAVLLRGPGGNGKSTLIDILCGMVPSDYIARVSPFQFSDPLYLSQLSNKMLNIATELERGQKLPAASFKNVVDSSYLTAKALYNDPFIFPSTAAHVFSSNWPLLTTDGSRGMQRRWLMLLMENTVDPKERVAELGREIVNKEAPQIFNWALEGARRVEENKGFTQTKASRRLLAETFMDTDPITNFINDDDWVIVDMKNKKARVSRSGLYRAYREWFRETGQRSTNIETKRRFNAKLDEYGYNLCKYQGRMCWKGLILRTQK